MRLCTASRTRTRTRRIAFHIIDNDSEKGDEDNGKRARTGTRVRTRTGRKARMIIIRKGIMMKTRMRV